MAVYRPFWQPGSPTVESVQAQSGTKVSRLIDVALWAASFGLLILSFLFSWGSPPGFGPETDWADKAWHFLGYAALCSTLLLAAVWRPGRGAGRFSGTAVRVSGLVLAIAWLTEALQAPFGRDADLLDAVADLAGVAAGFVLWSVLTSWRGRPEPPRRASRLGAT